MNRLAQKFHDKHVGSMPLGPDGKTPQYHHRFCMWMNLLDDRVHDDEYVCRWVPPYGFVPEAGCPEHD